MGSNPTRCARKPFAFASGFFHAVLQEKRHFPGQKVPKFGPLIFVFFLISLPFIPLFFLEFSPSSTLSLLPAENFFPWHAPK